MKRLIGTPRQRQPFSAKNAPARKVRATTKNGGKGSAPRKPWGGRFLESTHALVEEFSASLDVDRRLYEQDIQGSIAHAQTLERAKVLTRQECQSVIRGLEAIRKEIRDGRFPFSSHDEDIHMAIERRLTQRIGPTGGKLHTGRSRNDQITLDLRLYLREVLNHLLGKIQDLQQALVSLARRHIHVMMPGYTHLQRAQPVLFAHHLLAYVEMLERDRQRLHDALTRINTMPLGSGALAGSNYPVDRLYTAKLLGFPRVSQNSLDAVSDRDYVVEVLSALAVIMMHLSRLSEELIVWSSQEFQFVELPDGFCTGSSMMPQKKNPDVPELIRGKTGRVYGHLMSILTTLKGLPLSYNRDLQEDKEPLFNALDTVLDSVKLYAELFARLRIHPENMTAAVQSGFLLATELADYLVKKGVPFREAHSLVGQLVKASLEKGQELRDLNLSDLQSVSTRFSRDALTMLAPQGAIDRKNQIGGTSRHQVEKQVRKWEKTLWRSTKSKTPVG